MQPLLNLNLSQKVAMTPQLAASIRFLQLSAAELAEELKSALQDNVLLEEDGSESSEQTEPENNDIEWQPAESSAAEDWGASRGPARESDDGRGEERIENTAQSIRMQMLEQIQMRFDDEASLRIAAAIIDATDDSGYLQCGIDDIVADLAPIQLVLPAQVNAVLHEVQRMDPIAYASRSLAECLRIQIEELQAADQTHAEELKLAADIVDFHMQALGTMDIDSLIKATGKTEDNVAAALRLIRGLAPKPAAEEQAAGAIIPDVVLEPGSDKGWSVRLNRDGMPAVRINAEYERIVASDPSAKGLRSQLQDARWLVRSVEMRNDTLLRATRFIFEHQPDFLKQGETGLRPLTLKFVADGIGVHESTISRITTSKYVQTPHGVFSLKTFFPSQLTVAEGVASSGTAVKATIAKLIEREQPDQPLRDVDLAAIFARRGVRIARRTIAKYREALGIASSRDRQAQYRREELIRRRVAAPLTRLAG